MGADPNQNREEGKIFEELFLRQARGNGLLALKNNLQAKYVRGGRIQLIKSELDFKLIDQSGKVGYFDCKSFKGDHFSYSVLDAKQVERSVTYNHWKVPSGFIVWFRESDQVVYFSGFTIEKKGERSRFEVEDGILLGTFSKFNLKILLQDKCERPILGTV